MNEKYTNPKIRCKNYMSHLSSIPDNCYNCVKRSGLPAYLFGDENCENFQLKPDGEK